MAQGKLWFKVWVSILTDIDFDELHNQTIGVWVRLAALVKQHGDDGKISLPLKKFKKWSHLEEVEKADLERIINDLKTINVLIIIDECYNCNVTFKNWPEYQSYSDSYERVKKHRANKKNVTKVTPTRAREEKRREEKQNKKKNLPPQAYRLAGGLALLILRNNPNSVTLAPRKRGKVIHRWADDIEKLFRINKRPWAEINKVLRWSQSDPFWSGNILSASTLRKQWDKLTAAMMRSKGQGPARPTMSGEQRDSLKRQLREANDMIERLSDRVKHLQQNTPALPETGKLEAYNALPDNERKALDKLTDARKRLESYEVAAKEIQTKLDEG